MGDFLQNTISNIKLNIEKSLNILDFITEENFSTEFPKAVRYIKEAGKITKDFKVKCSPEQLQEFENKLYPLTKQLKDKFDNIIAGKQQSIIEIAKELKELNNKKKLVNYSR